MSRSIRMFDLLLAGPALASTAPVLAFAAIAILVDDGGPVVFAQERVGRRRVPFVVYKLRTMRGGRVTRVGRWLRRTRIDELPQLVNVVRGEMSLAGPRPITASDVTRLGWDRAAADDRWCVRPGITGPTQLSTVCDAGRALERDLDWARSAGLADHVECLARTVFTAVVRRSHAYRASHRWA